MDMNRRQFVAFSLLAGSLVLPLTSCTTKSQLGRAQSEYDPNYTVAEIFSTDVKRSSYIEYYDADLKLVNSIWYPYASLTLGGKANSPLPISNDEIYLIPRGLMWQEDDRKVISLNFKTGEIREYQVDQISITGIAVDNNYFYTINNLNGTGHVGRINKISGEATYLDLGTVTLFIVSLDDGFCVAWADIAGENGDVIYLSIYTSELELVNTTNLTTEGIDVIYGPTAHDNGRFCFICGDNEPSYDTIYSFDTNSFELKKLCTLNYSVLSITLQSNLLFTFGYGDTTLITANANYIEVYDSTSGELLSSLGADYSSWRGVFNDGFLYVSGDNILAKYKVDNANIVAVAQTPLSSITEGTETLSFSGIFSKP